jgi:hypothetical protein
MEQLPPGITVVGNVNDGNNVNEPNANEIKKDGTVVDAIELLDGISVVGNVGDEEPVELPDAEVDPIYKSDIDIRSFFDNDGKTRQEKDFSYFNKDFNKLDEEIGGIFGNLEETVTSDLNRKFKKYGFVFEESGIGTDEVFIRSTVDPNIKKTVSLSDPNEGMSLIKNFIDKNKRESAVFTEDVDTKIEITDDYIQDLLKATAEKDTGKQQSILQGISRMIYASEGVSYDEIKNIEERGKHVDEEISFIEQNLVSDEGLRTAFFLGPDAAAPDSYTTNYVPTKEDIEKYPDLFDEKGNLKVTPYSYMSKLKTENENNAEITTSEFVYDLKQKEKNLFDRFKNAQITTISDSMKDIAKVSAYTNNKFKEITGYDVSDWRKANDDIEEQVEGFDFALKQITNGTGLADIAEYKTTDPNEQNQINEILEGYNAYYQQTVEPINNVYMNYKLLGDKQKQVASLGNTLQAMLNFDNLYKIRGVYEEGKGLSVWNNVKKGWSQGVMNAELMKIHFGINDINDEEELATAAKRVAEEGAYQQGILTSEVWERYQAAGTVQEQLSLLRQDPGEVLLSLFGNSMSMFLRTGSNLILPIIGTGLATGAIAGGVPTGGVGIIPGALSSLAYTLPTWQGMTAYAMEMGSAYSETLTKMGYDIANEGSVMEGLRNPEVVKEASRKGNSRGIPIAITSFIGGRVAGGLVSPISSTAKQLGTTLFTGLTLEPVFEAGGETIAQLLDEGKLIPTEILNEAIGGMPGAGTNISAAWAQKTLFQTQTKLAKDLLNLNQLSKQNYSYTDIDAFSNRLYKNGKITLDTREKLLENARINDQANSLMRKSPKFVKGKGAARIRMAELLEHKKVVEAILEDAVGKEKSNVKKQLDEINSEINTMSKTGKVDVNSKTKTLGDLASLYKRNLSAGVNFINRKLKKEGYQFVDANKENIQQIKDTNPDLFKIINKFKDSSGFITPEVNGTKYLVVNSDTLGNSYTTAILNGDTSGFSTLSHEILHAVLDEAFTETEVNQIGQELETFLQDDANTELTTEAKSRIAERLAAYEERYGGKDKRYYQEVFTTISDEIQKENITYNRKQDGFFTKIKNLINQFIDKNKNVFDEVVSANMKIQTPEQAFNFIKDYNKVFNEDYRQSRRKQNQPIAKARKEITSIASKPDLKMSFVTRQELSNAKNLDNVVKKNNEIKEEFKELKKLINCLWK